MVNEAAPDVDYSVLNMTNVTDYTAIYYVRSASVEEDDSAILTSLETGLAFSLQKQFGGHKTQLAQGVHLEELGIVAHIGAIQLGQQGSSLFSVVQGLAVEDNLIGRDDHFMVQHGAPPFAKSKAALQPPQPDKSLMNIRLSVVWF